MGPTSGGPPRPPRAPTQAHLDRGNQEKKNALGTPSLGCFEKHPTQHNKTRQTNPDFTPQNQLNATFPLSLGGLEGSAPEFAVFRPSGKLDRNHRNIQ